MNIFIICFKTWYNFVKIEIFFITDDKGDIVVLDCEISLFVGKYDFCCN